MQNEQKPSLPLNLLVLDVLGLVLIGVGVTKLVAGIDILPAGFRFEHYELAFIVIGIGLALPYAVHVFKKSASRTEGKRL